MLLGVIKAKVKEKVMANFRAHADTVEANVGTVNVHKRVKAKAKAKMGLAKHQLKGKAKEKTPNAFLVVDMGI